MESLSPIILSLVTFIPAAGGLLILLIPRRDRDIKLFALVISMLAFVASLHLPVHLHRDHNLFKFEIDKIWITTPNIHYHMGIDGISVWLVVLTTFLTPLCVLISWTSIHERVKEFFILLLILETALIGVFTSLDLVPVLLLLGSDADPDGAADRHVRPRTQGLRRGEVFPVHHDRLDVHAGGDSVALCQDRQLRFCHHSERDSQRQRARFRSTPRFGSSSASSSPLRSRFRSSLFIPGCPTRTWKRLPPDRCCWPGVLLKMGTYGLLRFDVGLFPDQARRNAPWIMVLALIGIIYGALVSLVQPNMKKLIAYSSVSHLGFVVLGIFSFTTAGLNGAVFVMLAHGVATGGLFMLAGILYERRHTYEITEFGGLATPMPKYATFFLVTVLASVGLPLLNGFIGEFLVLSGAFQARPIYGILAATGVIWSACYLLWMYQRVFFGKVTHEVNNTLPDLNLREKAALSPIAVAALVMGVAPLVWLSAIDPAVQAIRSRSLHPIGQQGGGPMTMT